MSWEDQGWQYHSWFGHGTSSGDAGGSDVPPPSVADDVAAAAVGSMGGAARTAFAAVLRAGGAGDLAEVLPIWVASSGLAPGRFRALLVGRGFGAEGSAAIQAVGRSLAGGVDAGAVTSAGLHLAAALGSLPGEDWRYGLNTARDVAVEAVRAGWVPSRPALITPEHGQQHAMQQGDGKRSDLVAPVNFALPVGPIPFLLPPVAIPGTKENEETTRSLEDLLRGIRHLLFGTAGEMGDKTSLSPNSPSILRTEKKSDPPETIRPPETYRGAELGADRHTPPLKIDGDDIGATRDDSASDAGPSDEASAKRAEIKAAENLLPPGMDRKKFAELADFVQGLDSSKVASTDASDEVIDNLKAHGVTKEAIEAFRNIYEKIRGNASATHRAAKLNSILRKW